MGTTNPKAIDEETPLLSSPDEALQKNRRTPLPKLQVTIVLFLQFCEPITGLVIYPYINQLVSELDIIGGDKRKVGYYAGLIESLFFVAEALTVLHWGRLSDRIGRKPVLLVGLIGSSLSILCFGLSRTFWMLVVSRSLCGFLNGNIGVMKTVMGELTDSSNRAQIFSWSSLVWAVGATLGPLIGGSLSKPRELFPNVFRDEFWKEYPYFLPCLAASSFVFAAIIMTFIFFKETMPKRKRVDSISSETTLTDTTDRYGPLPLRKILVYPVIVSVANYVTVAFLDIMLFSLVPLFFAMPVEIGGLGFKPSTIGYLLGGYGVITGIFNVLCLAKILERFSEKHVFFAGMSIFVPCFILMPIMSLCAKTWGVGPLVWSLVALEFFLMVLRNLSYGTIFMYITASAPNRRSLGATNGLSQMAASVARAIGPAMSTSLFSYSVQHQVLGGNGIYVLMTVLSLFSLFVATLLPTRVWKDNGI